jgi:NADPH:quinone reductase-like Zn-dependent oxidoreductase
MRAALFSEHGGPEVVRVDEVPDPEPGPGEVRVAVRASAMNHLDLWARRGLPVEIPLPHIGGSDIAGVVDAVGPGVEGVSAGTPVVVDPSLAYERTMAGRWRGGGGGERFRLIGEHVDGGFAEFVVVPAANLMPMPDGFSFEEAAAAPLVFVTAWRGLVVRGRLRAGERVLVTGGSGGVATAAIQIARRAGAHVYAVTSGAASAERARSLGAHVVYDRLEVDYSREVWRDTGKEGVDLVLDSVGEALWTSNLRTLAQGGRLVTYGATTGAAGDTNIRLVFWKQLSILGSTMGTPAEFREVMDLVFRGELHPVVDRVLPLAEARKAHELLEAGDVFGKLVLVP